MNHELLCVAHVRCSEIGTGNETFITATLVGVHTEQILSYTLQWDRMNSSIWWAGVGQWIPKDSPTCPMVQWDRTDSGFSIVYNGF